MRRQRPIPGRRPVAARGKDGVKRVVLPLEARHRGERLDTVLEELLPKAWPNSLSRSVIRKLIVAGAVRDGDRPLRQPKMPLPRDVFCLTVLIDPSRLSTAEDRRPLIIAKKDIVFEDEVLLVVNKPSGYPTHPTIDPKRPNLMGAVEAFLKKRAGGEEVYLGLHHRLDAETSGLVVFTLDRAVNAKVGAGFAERQVKKQYLALVRRGEKLPPRSWEVESYLGPIGKSAGRAKYGSVRAGGDHALTRFELIEEGARGLLVRAFPHTGRTHQIRIHLSEGGMPILGDDLYGSPHDQRAASRLMLHAECLEMTHPLTGKLLKLRAAPPEEFKTRPKADHS